MEGKRIKGLVGRLEKLEGDSWEELRKGLKDVCEELWLCAVRGGNTEIFGRAADGTF